MVAKKVWWILFAAQPILCLPVKLPWLAVMAMWAKVLPLRCMGQVCRVIVTEIDPICALQAAMGWL